MKNDTYIKGILLGYGDTNTRYFCRRSQLMQYLRRFPSLSRFSKSEDPFVKNPTFQAWIKVPYAIQKLEPSSGFYSLEEEWSTMREVWWETRNEREVIPPFLVGIPFYVCQHGGDSEIVREKYIRARIKLANLFSGKSFQQAVKEEAARR